nr:unnamed protein product [Callosobruchus chinensis]
MFTEIPEFNPDELSKLQGHEPINFYLLFIDDIIQNKLVEETNKYAEQKIIEAIAKESVTKHSLSNQWKPTDKEELLRFLALIIWMGLDKKPGLRDYWSTNILYKNDISKICGISRNRFEVLLHFFHISDNELCPAAKLKKGEMKCLQSNSKVVVGKWRDKRGVLFLTTKEVPTMVEVPTKRGPVKKPSTIAQYNAAKSFIDVSDQKASYHTPIRRSIKWYRKIAVELLTNTALVNAHVLYTHVTGNKLSISEFREKIVLSLISQNVPPNSYQEHHQHAIEEKDKRGRCTMCYKTYSEREGRESAMKNSKRVHTFCPACIDFPFMCVKCFFSSHVSTLKK